MSRLYAVTFQAVAITAVQDLFEITPGDDKPVALHGVFLSQYTDLGDAAEEILRWSVVRGHTTGGSGGSAPTPAPLNPHNTVAAVFGAEVNNTTVASAGTTTTLHADGFNIRSGLAHWWTPETRPKASQANTTIVVRLVAAPADSVTVDGTLYVEELL